MFDLLPKNKQTKKQTKQKKPIQKTIEIHAIQCSTVQYKLQGKQIVSTLEQTLFLTKTARGSMGKKTTAFK